MLEISKRLQVVAQQVQYQTIADVGTDHGYIPLYLYLKNRLKKAYACDINKGPLKQAEKNIKAYDASSCIEIRLGSGLESIGTNQIETAVIAGMGGMLIIEILETSLPKVKTLKELVLQPQLDVNKVRQYLHRIGFQIENEEMIFEEKKYYTVLRAVPGEEIYTNEKEYLFGKKLIEKKDSILKQYCKETSKNNQNIINQLKTSKSIYGKQRIEQLEKMQILIKEVLDEL